MSAFWKWLSHPPAGEEVVVTGIAGRLPESNNIHEFRHNLFNKIDMVTEDARRWKIDHPEVPTRSSKINDIDKFDGGFFGVHYRQADVMDPMVRASLEVAIESIMDAGVNPAELKGSRTGVFFGACASETEILCNFADASTKETYAVTGILRSAIANRISYYLRLKGPSMIVDSACSSSLNAFELALKSIRCGECDNAVVGGVNLVLHPANTLHFYRLGVLSKDGKCKVFDQEADGYVRAESAVSVFLQRSNAARRIYATVLNSKVNSDGFKEQGITFPSTAMQLQLIEDVFEEGGFQPQQLGFLEAHGTGTQIGDPQEVEAIDRALAQKRSTPLLIGSVKCSIGHSEPASGLCSLLKLIIASESGFIPPNIHLHSIKQGMSGFEQGRLKVVTELTKLEGDDALLGINNFGFGGNNGHLLVQRFAKTKTRDTFPKDDVPRLVCISGRTEESVLGLLDDVARAPLDDEYVALLHQLFKSNFNEHIYRGFAVVDVNGCLFKSSVVKVAHAPRKFRVFLGDFRRDFRRTARNFLQFPCFRAALEEINDKQHIDVFDLIGGQEETVYDPVAALAVQIGFLEVLRVLEVQPTAVYGESLGKIACAYHYEVLTMEEALQAAFDLIGSTETKKTPVDEFSGDVCTNYFDAKSDGARNLHDKSLVFNLSDGDLGGMRLVHFLASVGRLFEEGYNPQIYNLYPSVEFPVSRGTPMISPLVKWHHAKSWYTYKFSEFEITSNAQKHIFSCDLHEEHKYMLGHFIDGRNLFPATEYLNIVWKTFVQNRRLLQEDVSLIFENCKFLRAVTIPHSGPMTLYVSIQNTGAFEVIDQNSYVIVTGRIHAARDISGDQLKLPPIEADLEDPLEVFDQDDIYKELYLRNYNYGGFFKGIVKCNTDATVGYVRWENNWTTFMDKMLQMKILQYDTKLLYVPTSIKKLSINPLGHLKFVNKHSESTCPVYIYKTCNVIKSGGIEICGLRASSIAKRKPTSEPVLEEYVFVSNIDTCDIERSIRILTQTVLENSFETNFRAVEIPVNSQVELVLPLMRKVLDDLPMVTPDLTVSTTQSLDSFEGVKVQEFILTPTSNVLLIVTSNLLQSPNVPLQILSALTSSGFIITRERLDCVPTNHNDLEILMEHTTKTEKLVLCRKRGHVKTYRFIEMKSDCYDWFPHLQEALKRDEHVFIHGRNEQPEGIVGFLNCIRREPRGKKVKCLFIMDAAPPFDPENPFYKNEIERGLAVNVYKDGSWGTYRHLLLEEPSQVECVHCYVNTTKRGDLSSLRWLQGPLRRNTEHDDNEIIVYPYYAAINFKDIMTASGRVNIDAISTDRLVQECMQGFELSGRDASGRRVVGMGNAALSTMLLMDKRTLVEVPDCWSMEEAATLTVVYSTAIYALIHVGKLQRGASVLIHSGTGGVGLAAINICLHYECDIFLTVGTREKRDYIKTHFPQIPEDHVGDSRDSFSFEEMVKVRTNGRGVDFVLNSLSEEKLRASVRCLAKGGCFLEIGKFDIGIDADLNLLLAERCISFHGIMIDQMVQLEKRILLSEILVDAMKKGIVKPLPRIIFQKDQVEEAFRYMGGGKHIGKVLLQIREEEENSSLPYEITYRAIPRFGCDSTKTYVIIGGLGGFGLELADWLFLRGAKKLVLVSRFGKRSGYHTLKIRNWEAYGVKIKVSTADVTTEEGCLNLLEESSAMGRIDGIFNLAVVLQDGVFENQTQEMFATCLAPKAGATRHLDIVTRRHCPDLRYFVVFSSVACGRGNAGQTNYGMANSIMERICEKRKLDGFPALAIQWGAIGNVGLVAKMQRENRELVIGGTLQQKVSSCLEVLDKFLVRNCTIVSSMVVAEKNARAGDTIVDAIANILGIKHIKSVGFYKTLAELGMDSITTGEVINVLEKEFDIFIPPKDIRSLTFAKLMEMEAERRNANENFEKAEEGAKYLLKYIPTAEQNQSVIVRLASGLGDADAGPTVLVFPGLEGVFHPLEFLCGKLEAHVFGVNYSYGDSVRSIEELASNILPHIETKLDTNSKFNIIAYSFGSLVATEVICALEEKGYAGNFFAIDGSHAYIREAVNKHFPVQSDAEFETMLLHHILGILLPVEVAAQHKMSLLSLGSFEERIDFGRSLLSLDAAKRQELDSKAAITLLSRLKSAISYSFQHDKFKSSTYLFKAQYAIVDDMDDDYELSEVCQNPAIVCVVRGDHGTILNQSDLVGGINKHLL